MTCTRSIYHLSACRAAQERPEVGFDRGGAAIARTAWQFRNCTSVGKWVRVRGKVMVRNEGTIRLGDRVRFRAKVATSELATWNGGTLEIGEGTTINYGSSISAAGLVKIGKDCLIGTYVNIMDCTFHNIEDRSWSLDAEPVIIGDRCVAGQQVHDNERRYYRRWRRGSRLQPGNQKRTA